MRTAIMQPYFLPYLGYFQLIASVDCFVVYDTIKYTKKGWINRNRFLRNGEPASFSLPISKASDDLHVVDRHISEAFEPKKLCAQIAGAYRKAPEFDATMPLIEAILHHPERNLFRFLYHSLEKTCDHLGLRTPLRISSDVEGGQPTKTGAERVKHICMTLGAKTYINPPGGRALYDHDDFAANGLDLKFLEPRLTPYAQFGNGFQPGLSILDLLMFVPLNTLRDQYLSDYEIID